MTIQEYKDRNSDCRTVLRFALFPTKMTDGEIIWFKFFYKKQRPFNYYNWVARNGTSGYGHYWQTIEKSIKPK